MANSNAVASGIGNSRSRSLARTHATSSYARECASVYITGFYTAYVIRLTRRIGSENGSYTKRQFYRSRRCSIRINRTPNGVTSRLDIKKKSSARKLTVEKYVGDCSTATPTARIRVNNIDIQNIHNTKKKRRNEIILYYKLNLRKCIGRFEIKRVARVCARSLIGVI